MYHLCIFFLFYFIYIYRRTNPFKINEVVEGMLVNSAEKYKPIKKELKNALTAAEIRTILGL